MAWAHFSLPFFLLANIMRSLFIEWGIHVTGSECREGGKSLRLISINRIGLLLYYKRDFSYRYIRESHEATAGVISISLPLQFCDICVNRP